MRFDVSHYGSVDEHDTESAEVLFERVCCSRFVGVEVCGAARTAQHVDACLTGQRKRTDGIAPAELAHHPATQYSFCPAASSLFKWVSSVENADSLLAIDFHFCVWPCRPSSHLHT